MRRPLLEGSVGARRDALAAWVAESRAGWQLATRGQEVGPDGTRTGLELTLLARDPRGLRGEPGDAASYHTWRMLQSVALRVLSRVQAGRWRFDPFDHSFHLRRETGLAPEVQFTATLDPVATDSLAAFGARREEVARALERLGVRNLQ